MKPKSLAIDTCDRCGSQIAPLQIVFKNLGFEALCLDCKAEYNKQKKKQDEQQTKNNHR